MNIDVLVLGGGSAGMTAAAQALGLRVLLCEATDQVGGTSASAGGTIWIPLTHHAQAAGVFDTRENVLRYLKTLIGDSKGDKLIETFVDSGAAAVRFLEQHTELHLRSWPASGRRETGAFCFLCVFPNVRWCLIVSATNRRYSSHSPASAASSDTAKAAVAGLLSVATMFSAYGYWSKFRICACRSALVLLSGSWASKTIGLR